MIEPLSHDTITSWNEFFDRFDQVIYPTIFEPRRISKSDALHFWSNNLLRTDIEEMLNAIKGSDKDEWEK